MRDENFEQTLAQKIHDAVQDAIPVGKVDAFLRSSPPKGWLALNGQKVYQSVHAELYGYLSGLSKLTKGSDSTGAYVTLPDLDGRVIQGTNDASRVGELLEASLPNITGEVWPIRSRYTKKGSLSTNGVFSSSQVQDSNASQGNSNDLWNVKLKFEASKFNPIYSGSTLNPRACLTLLCIKS